MHPSSATTLLALALALVLATCMPAASAAPVVVDKRDGYTGRLFAHHAHERVGATPAPPSTAPVAVTAALAPSSSITMPPRSINV